MATDYGKRLKQAREHAGLTQEELRIRAGVAQSTLSAAEATGQGSRKTAQLAAACGVDAHWLATGEGEMLAATPLVAVRTPAALAPTVAQTVARLGELLGAASPKTRDTVAQLLLRYAQDPADGARIAQAIELLLKDGGA